MTRLIGTIVAGTLVGAALARAEDPPASGGLSLQAVAADAGLVPRSERGVKRPLVVDRCRSLRVIVTATEKAEVALEMPDGSLLTKGSGAPVAGWHVFEGEGGGEALLPRLSAPSSTLVTLEDPPPGRYVVHLAREGEEEVPFTIASWSDSALRMGLWVASPYVITGEPVVLSALLDEDGEPARDARTEVVLSRVAESGYAEKVGEAALHDDGRDGDAQAGDGIYSAVVRAERDGVTWASVRARGRSADGDDYERMGALRLEASKGTVAVDARGTPSWRRGSERVDALVLDFSAAGDGGDYDLTLTVRAPNGRSVTGGARLRLEGGSGAATVAVPSALVKTLGVDGPYAVESVAVHDRKEPRGLRASRALGLLTPEIRLSDLE